MMNYFEMDPCEQISVKFESKFKVFIQENEHENVVCGMAAILFMPYVLTSLPSGFPIDSVNKCL